jgi:hypothetical protein
MMTARFVGVCGTVTGEIFTSAEGVIQRPR